MIFEQNELCEIYVNLFNWLAGHSSGKSHAYKSYHNSMDKKYGSHYSLKLKKSRLKRQKQKKKLIF